ncbi:HTH araC/xylS-type domain-containing protein [Paraburkholderia sacchari]|uniref:AraC family transcriptional regulator n=1 Tax=Paraburkholderia sacchari TaxID=159450 RepID=UPI0039A67341
MKEMTRVSALIGYRELVSAMGGQPDQLLKRFQIEPQSLDREENRVPYRSIIRLLEATAAELQCPDFGLRLSQRQGLEVLGPIGLIGLNSPTVGDAIAAMIEHLAFYSPAVISTIDRTTDPKRPRITFDATIEGTLYWRQTVELAVGIIVRDLQVLCGGHFVAERILFRHASPVPKSVYHTYFRTRVDMEQDVNAVVVKPEDLTHPLNGANPYLKEVVADYVRQSAGSAALDLRAQVAFLARRLLPSRACTLTKVAQQLCLHERTLQRRLKESTLVFEEIVDSIRRERAEELLKESHLSISQVAAMLGYVGEASLNRSCRRWFGVPPLQVRKGSLKRDSVPAVRANKVRGY